MSIANTPITELFACSADWPSAMAFCRSLEIQIHQQREALEAADECLALIEDVGHGVMAENVTVARKIVLNALSPFSTDLHKSDSKLPRFDYVNGQWVKHNPKPTEANTDYQ